MHRGLAVYACVMTNYPQPYDTLIILRFLGLACAFGLRGISLFNLGGFCLAATFGRFGSFLRFRFGSSSLTQAVFLVEMRLVKAVGLDFVVQCLHFARLVTCGSQQ